MNRVIQRHQYVVVKKRRRELGKGWSAIVPIHKTNYQISLSVRRTYICDKSRKLTMKCIYRE